MAFITYGDLIKMPYIAEAFDVITYLIAIFIAVLWHIMLTVALTGDVVFDADTFRNRFKLFFIFHKIKTIIPKIIKSNLYSNSSEKSNNSSLLTSI